MTTQITSTTPAVEQLNINYSHRNEDQQQMPSLGSKRTVQDLNNLGCVNLTMGNFAKANYLFEAALKRHRAITEHVSSNTATYIHRGYNSFDDDPHAWNDGIVDFHDESESSEDMDMDMEMESASSDEWNCHESPVPANESGIEVKSNATPLFSSEQSFNSNHLNKLPRVTSSSLVLTTPYSGQHHINKSPYREVYCLPIVMDDLEWESASSDDKTFILIFNSAMCNQLWGMHFQQLEHRRGGLTKDTNRQSNRAFTVADSLYRLALGHAVNLTARTQYQLWLLAVLNNLSHISYTMKGPGSDEAIHFDQILLKAIFWYRDSKEQKESNLNSGHQMGYEDDDVEIVALFLDYVFYLIATPESLQPAAAA